MEVDWQLPTDRDQSSSGLRAIEWLHERVCSFQQIPSFLEARHTSIVEHAVEFAAGADIQLAFEVILDVDREMMECGMGLHDSLQDWFLNVAVPAAYACRELDERERESLQKPTFE